MSHKREKERHNIAMEFYTTEVKYVKWLGILVNNFRDPLQQRSIEDQGHGNEPIVTEHDLIAIFQNVQQIKKLSVKIEKELKEQVIEDWDGKGMIGELFLKFSEDLAVYRNFINNYSHSQERLENCLKKEKFTKFIKVCEKSEQCERQTLKQLLIQPVQRLPRYPLLLGSLLKVTPLEHPDYPNIQRAIANISLITKDVNDFKRDTDAIYRAISLHSRIENLLPNTITSGSKLLCELDGKQVHGPERGAFFGIFLLNDKVIIANKINHHKYKYSNVISLERLILVEIEQLTGNLNQEIVAQADKLFGLMDDQNRKQIIFESGDIDEKEDFFMILRPFLQDDKTASFSLKEAENFLAAPPVKIVKKKKVQFFQVNQKIKNFFDGNKENRKEHKDNIENSFLRRSESSASLYIKRKNSTMSISSKNHATSSPTDLSSESSASLYLNRKNSTKSMYTGPTLSHSKSMAYLDKDDNFYNTETARFTMVVQPQTNSNDSIVHKNSIKRRPSQGKSTVTEQKRRTQTFPSYSVLSLKQEEAFKIIYNESKETVESVLKQVHPDLQVNLNVKLKLTQRNKIKNENGEARHSVGDDDVITYPVNRKKVTLGELKLDLNSLSNSDSKHDKSRGALPPVPRPRKPPNSQNLRLAKQRYGTLKKTKDNNNNTTTTANVIDIENI